MRRHIALVVVLAFALGGAATRPVHAVTYLYLSIDIGGNGSGAWQSLDGYIDCRSVNGYVDPRDACDAEYVADFTGKAVVPYTVTPAQGSCTQEGSTCNPSPRSDVLYLVIDTSQFVRFDVQTLLLTVTKSGAGTGKVVSTPAGIDCGALCNKTYNYGTGVTLTAVPDQGAYFAGWTGACSGQTAACALTITVTTATNAVFGFGTAPTPSPSPGATPLSTPKSSAKPPATKAPATTAPGSTSPTVSVPPSETLPTTGPGSSVVSAPTVLASPLASNEPLATPPAVPAGGTSEGSIALAIFGAGGLVALAIGVVGFLLLRRRPGTSA